MRMLASRMQFFCRALQCEEQPWPGRKDQHAKLRMSLLAPHDMRMHLTADAHVLCSVNAELAADQDMFGNAGVLVPVGLDRKSVV